jgi:hypothetical protein
VIEFLEDRRLLAAVNFSIDPQQDSRPISKFVYGVNQSLDGNYANAGLHITGKTTLQTRAATGTSRMMLIWAGVIRRAEPSYQSCRMRRREMLVHW